MLDGRAANVDLAKCAIWLELSSACVPANHGACDAAYLHRVRSSRLLEAECHRNLEVIWLLGKLVPDFKTIADFRKDNLKPLKAVSRRFTWLCRKLRLFGGELLAIDGSKFRAVNARDKNFNAGKLQELIAHTDARLTSTAPQSDCTNHNTQPTRRGHRISDD